MKFKFISGYQGHGKKYGIIKYGNGRTFRLGRFALHVWKPGPLDNVT